MNNVPRRIFPANISGYELKESDGFFSFVAATYEDAINLVTNPSFEIDLTGIVTSGINETQSSEKQYRGFYSMKCTPTASLGQAVQSVSESISGNDYTFSADIYVPTNFSVYLIIQHGTTTITRKRIDGTSTWQRTFVTHRSIGGTVRVGFESRGMSTFYTDGWQYEKTPYPTTYFDGDSIGFVFNRSDYQWSGERHLSTSTRFATAKNGGREFKFSDFGFRTLGFSGTGSPNVENISESLFQGGAFYQRTVFRDRQLSISGAIVGKTLSEIDDNRKNLEKYIVDQIIRSQEPLMLIYNKTNSFGDVYKRFMIPCFYVSGLSGSNNNISQESLTIAFEQLYPEIYEENPISAVELETITSIISDLTDEEITVYKDGNNYWTKIFDKLVKIFYNRFDGAIWFYGYTGTLNGVANTDGFARYVNNTLSAQGTGVSGGIIKDMDVNSRGDVVVVGDFTSAGGVASTANAAMFRGGTWYSLSATLSGILELLWGVIFDKSGENFVVIGSFNTINAVANTVCIAYRNITTATWYPIGTGVNSASATTYPVGLTRDDSGNIYVWGKFAAINGVTTGVIAKLVEGGVKWNTVVKLSGVRLTAVTSGTLPSALFYNQDGYLYFSGADVADPTDTTPYNLSRWNGSDWKQIPGVDQTVSTKLAKFSNYIVCNPVFTSSNVNKFSTLMKINGTSFEDFDVLSTQSIDDMNFGYLNGRKDGYISLANRFFTVIGQNVYNNTKGATNKVTFLVDGPITLFKILNDSTGGYINFAPLVLSHKEWAIIEVIGSSISIKTNSEKDLYKTITGKSGKFVVKSGENVIRTMVPHVGSYLYFSDGLNISSGIVSSILGGIKKSNSTFGALWFSVLYSAPNTHLAVYSEDTRSVLVAESETYTAVGTNMKISEIGSSGISGYWSPPSMTANANAGMAIFGTIEMCVYEMKSGIA